jgi:hypothetical protein
MNTRLCGKQTQYGQAAWKNTSGFAPCIRAAGHRDKCDSGPATPQPPKAA